MHVPYAHVPSCVHGQAFDRADMDKSGKISQLELYICLLEVYEEASDDEFTLYLTHLCASCNSSSTNLWLLDRIMQFNIRLPTHVKAPNRQDMQKLLKKVDSDGDGELSFPEFLEATK